MDKKVEEYLKVWDEFLNKITKIDEKNATRLRLYLERYELRYRRNTPDWLDISKESEAFERLKIKLELVLSNAITRYKLEKKSLTTRELEGIRDTVIVFLDKLELIFGS